DTGNPAGMYSPGSTIWYCNSTDATPLGSLTSAVITPVDEDVEPPLVTTDSITGAAFAAKELFCAPGVAFGTSTLIVTLRTVVPSSFVATSVYVVDCVGDTTTCVCPVTVPTLGVMTRVSAPFTLHESVTDCPC